jgi:hypothetical protein
MFLNFVQIMAYYGRTIYEFEFSMKFLNSILLVWGARTEAQHPPPPIFVFGTAAPYVPKICSTGPYYEKDE